MGVAVAKHRLEILKLARKESSSFSSSNRRAVAAITVLPWRATRLLAAAVHRSAHAALGGLRASVSRRWDRDLHRVVPVLSTPRVPSLLRHRGGGRVAHHSSWSKVASPAATIRAGKLTPLVPSLPMLTARVVSEPVVLTNSCADMWRGNGMAVRALPTPAGSIAAACLGSMDDDVCSCDQDGEEEVSDDELVVADGGEEMRWESMFQDLQPTQPSRAECALHL